MNKLPLAPDLSPAEFTKSYSEVQRILRTAGIVISRPDKRYRINFFGGAAETVCYTQTLEEALYRGLELAATRKGPAW
jgi:hypothetical protein